MPSLSDIRQQYPQYGDMSDAALSDALYKKFYSDIPRAEFDTKLGVAQQPQMSGGDIAADVAKSGGIGVVRGGIGIAGAPGDIGSMAESIGGWVGNKLGISPDNIAQSQQRAKSVGQYLPVVGPFFGPTSQDITKKIEGVTGEFYKPKTTAGEYAQTVGEFLPAAAVGPGGLAKRVATQAVIPGLTSEAAGQAAKGTVYEPYARAGGAVFGAMLPSAAARVVSPLPSSLQREAQVQTLANEGVPVTAGQRTGSKALQYAESALGDAPFGGNRASDFTTRQGEAFTSAALRRVGETAERATPDVMDRAFQRIGNVFDRVAANSRVRVDNTLLNDLQNAVDNYNSIVGASARAPIVANTVNDVGALARNGVLSGTAFQAMRSGLGRALKGASSGELKQALGDIQGALDDALIRHAHPSDVTAITEARRQYRNLMALTKATGGAGAQAAEGIISPAQLRGAVAGQNRNSYVRGKGDFAELARAGEAITKPLPQSGTTPRAMANLIPTLIGSGLGHMLDGGTGLGITAGGAAGAAASGLLGRAIMSRPAQAYLGNQAATPLFNSLNARQNMLLQAIMAQRAQQLSASSSP